MAKHILLVTIDSLRADFVHCYGSREIRTPNLDAFAASGVRFGHHLSSLATTLPSHCSLLTGCVPSVHGINWNGVDTPRRRLTLAEIAAAEGYATTAITSWGGFQKQQVYGFQQAHSEGGAGGDENRGDETILWPHRIHHLLQDDLFSLHTSRAFMKRRQRQDHRSQRQAASPRVTPDLQRPHEAKPDPNRNVGRRECQGEKPQHPGVRPPEHTERPR